MEGSSSCSFDHYNSASNFTYQSSWLLGHFEIMKWTFFKEGSEWDVLDIVDLSHNPLGGNDLRCICDTVKVIGSRVHYAKGKNLR